MPIMAADSGGGFTRQLPTPGMHHAVCSRVFDLGMQHNSYNGEMSYQHKVFVVMEIDEAPAWALETARCLDAEEESP